jgi:hypothetical protein
MMEKDGDQTDPVGSGEVLRRVKEKKNTLHTIKSIK